MKQAQSSPWCPLKLRRFRKSPSAGKRQFARETAGAQAWNCSSTRPFIFVASVRNGRSRGRGHGPSGDRVQTDRGARPSNPRRTAHHRGAAPPNGHLRTVAGSSSRHANGSARRQGTSSLLPRRSRVRDSAAEPGLHAARGADRCGFRAKSGPSTSRRHLAIVKRTVMLAKYSLSRCTNPSS